MIPVFFLDKFFILYVGIYLRHSSWTNPARYLPSSYLLLRYIEVRTYIYLFLYPRLIPDLPFWAQARPIHHDHTRGTERSLNVFEFSMSVKSRTAKQATLRHNNNIMNPNRECTPRAAFARHPHHDPITAVHKDFNPTNLITPRSSKRVATSPMPRQTGLAWLTLVKVGSHAGALDRRHTIWPGDLQRRWQWWFSCWLEVHHCCYGQ